MARATISPEEDAELNRLREKHRIAVERGAVMLARHGMASSEFAEAEKATGELSRRIRALEGIAPDTHWMAW
jgi:hypothetical protein